MPSRPLSRARCGEQVPGAFFSHGGALGKLLFDSTGTDANLNTWPVGVAPTHKFHGAASLDEFEKGLRKRIAALPNGDAAVVCELDRGVKRVQSDRWPSGYLWDRVGKAVCKD